MIVSSLIFLDFDGVLTTPKTKYSYFDHDCMDNLKKIVDSVDAFIVISSTWRMGSDIRIMSAMFEPFGMNDRVIGMTPIFHDHPRGDEVAQYLRSPIVSSPHYDLDIKSYVILDDDSDMGDLCGQLVQTDGQKGLQESDIDPAVRILKGWWA